MKPIVFAGPTIPAKEIALILDAECRGPAAQGDVYLASLERPPAIGIVDGYFEMQPAVWHKEVLWAMSEGIHVFGSASMGALRAAELWPFGMVGVGEIFEAYRDGVLEDDDEVALIHAGPECGFLACSDALVDIRATLRKAVREGIIAAGAADAALRFSKSQFYAERSYQKLLEEFPELEALRAWLPAGVVNQKRADAVAMLGAMRDFLAQHPEPKRVEFVLEESLWWELFRRTASQGSLRPADAAVLDQLRQSPREFERVVTSALGWWTSSREARRSAQPLPAIILTELGEDFCRQKGIDTAEDLARWLSENHCGSRELDQVLEARAHVHEAVAHAGLELDRYVLHYLRWTSEYSALLERAQKAGAGI